MLPILSASSRHAHQRLWLVQRSCLTWEGLLVEVLVEVKQPSCQDVSLNLVILLGSRAGAERSGQWIWKCHKCQFNCGIRIYNHMGIWQVGWLLYPSATVGLLLWQESSRSASDMTMEHFWYQLNLSFKTLDEQYRQYCMWKCKREREVDQYNSEELTRCWRWDYISTLTPLLPKLPLWPNTATKLNNKRLRMNFALDIWGSRIL